jgi:hypothetical protein
MILILFVGIKVEVITKEKTAKDTMVQFRCQFLIDMICVPTKDMS